MFWNLMWIELILLVVFMITVFSGLYIAIQGTPDGVSITDTDLAKISQLISWPGSLAFSLRFAAGSKFLLIIFIGAVTALEYTWRTYQMWLSRGVHCSLLLGTKFISLCLPVLLVVTGALIAGGAISAIVSLLINGILYLEQVNFWQLGLDIFRTACTLLPYAGITFLLAVATRSAVAAIGGCTAYGLIVESILPETLLLFAGRFGEIAKYLPANLMQSILSASWTTPALMDELLPGLLPPNQAAVSIAICTLSLFAMALWLFKRQDFSG